MKADVFNIKGEKIKEIELPKCFLFPVREDAIAKMYEASKKKQPYAPFILAGMQYSASGKPKHARRKWKTLYGLGVSRVPRKMFSRSGNRFSWQGATIASCRGGRQAHPPKIENMIIEKKINKKEKLNALFSAISATASSEIISSRYKLGKKELSLPLITESLEEAKTKDILSLLNKFLPNLKKKLLIVLSRKENIKSKVFDVIKTNNLSINELCPAGKPGRIVIYTENAINELKELK